MENGKLYYSIGEVSEMLDVNPSLLRFWETEFDCLRPKKNKKGTRSYTSEDIELLRRIHYLTKVCGFTLDGTREQLRNDKGPDKNMQLVRTINEVRDFLVSLKEEI